MTVSACPCGTGLTYAACCGPRHRWTAEARTLEALMRARYSAYVVNELDYVFRTWHPRTRPDRIEADPTLTWTGLTITAAGHDRVAFVATFERGGNPGELVESSRFEQRRGRWVYVDGVLA